MDKTDYNGWTRQAHSMKLDRVLFSLISKTNLLSPFPT